MWKLLKQLPGRRTAGVRWIDVARKVLTNELNIERCESNPCFYKGDGKSLLEMHMDDIDVAARSETEYEDLISKIREHLAIVASPPLVAASKYPLFYVLVLRPCHPRRRCSSCLVFSHL